MAGEVRQVPLGDGARPHGVIAGPDGAAWITDGGLNAIVRVDPGTETVKTWPLPDSADDANLNTPTFDRDVDDARQQVVGRRRAVAGFFEASEFDLGHRDNDRFLRAELVVDRGLRDTDRVGDHLERGAGRAVIGEQFERGGDGPALNRAVLRGSRLKAFGGCGQGHRPESSGRADGLSD